MIDWVTDMYKAVDSLNMSKVMSLFADDVRFQFGNMPPTIGKDAALHSFGAILGVAKGMSHQFLEVGDLNGKVTVVEADVTFTRWDDKVVTLPCVTMMRRKDEKIQDFRMYMDAAPLMAGPPAKIDITGAVQVNGPGREPKLTRSDLWKALVLKSEDATLFVPRITSCIVVERGDGYIVRDVVIEGAPSRERVTYEPEKRLIFTRIVSHEMGVIYNDIEEDEHGELWLRFTFNLEKQGVPDGSPLAQHIVSGMSQGYVATFEDVLHALRAASAGKIAAN